MVIIMQKEKIIQSDADLRGKFVEKKITDLVKNDKKCIKIYQNCQHFCTPTYFSRSTPEIKL